MTVKEAADKIRSVFKGCEIIEAMPGNNRFIFCVKPADSKEKIILDSYYSVDNKTGTVSPFPYGKYREEWLKGMDHQYKKNEYE